MEKIKFTEVETSTILTLVEERIEDGCYYGNKEQYYKRLDRIKLKLVDSYPKPNKNSG